MFCTKCGNQLKDDDLFCSKCGAKARAETIHAISETSSVTSKSQPPAGSMACPLTSRLKANPVGKKGVRIRLKRSDPLPLVVGGMCRYCGATMSQGMTACPECGARSQGNRYDPVTDVRRAAEIGKDLGRESIAGDIVENGLLGDSLNSCLFMPVVIINPCFWAQWFYKSKAKTALAAGNLDLAQELMEKSKLFAFVGWALIGIVVIICYASFSS